MLCVKKYLLDINKYIHPFNQHEMDLKGTINIKKNLELPPLF